MLYLITGGAGSGKSEYAEHLAEQRAAALRGRLFYIATMHRDTRDPDTLERIRKHQNRRKDKGYRTIECPTAIEEAERLLQSDPEGAELSRDTVLLEDLTNLYANEVYGTDGHPHAVLRPLRKLARSVGALIVVSNELYSDGIRYPSETDQFLRNLAKRTAALSAEAIEVTEVVAGLPLHLKKATCPETSAQCSSSDGPKSSSGTHIQAAAPEGGTERKEGMKLVMVIGGMAQGKHRFAAAAWPDAGIIDDTAACIRRQLQADPSVWSDPPLFFRQLQADAERLLQQLRTEHQDQVLIYPEVGSGVVPMDPEERIFREAVGRVGCMYAAAADEVYRVTAGLPIRLK